MDASRTVSIGASYLESGWPAYHQKSGGTILGFPYAHVGNVDQDAELEIVYQAPLGPMHAWNHDGVQVSGAWPYFGNFLHGRTVLGEFDGSDTVLEIFKGSDGSGSRQCELTMLDSNADVLAGFPMECGLSTGPQVVAVDLDGDGIDEVVAHDRYDTILVYANGTVETIAIPETVGYLPVALPPRVLPFRNPDMCGFATADFFASNRPDIVMWSCPVSNPTLENGDFSLLYLFDANLNLYSGFPRVFKGGLGAPVIADLDGDGELEIAVVTMLFSDQITDEIDNAIHIVGRDGSVEGVVRLPHPPYLNGSRRGVLVADLDLDGVAELMFRQQGDLVAARMDGTVLPGFPISGGSGLFAVGDVDADPNPEIVAYEDYDTPRTTETRTHLVVYNHDGSRTNMKATIDYMGRDPGMVSPIIADLDLDGRNEIVAIGDYWEGASGTFPQVWVFDFQQGSNHRAPQWSHYYGDAGNSNRLSIR